MRYLMLIFLPLLMNVLNTPVNAATRFQPEALWPKIAQSGRYFNFPRGIARDASGLFYITDKGSHRIKVLNAQGELLRSWGGLGSEAGQFNTPLGITVTASEVFIAEFANARIQVFTHQGQFLRQWGSLGSNQRQLNHPTYLTIGLQGHVYVSDAWNHRIQVFNQQGQWLQTIGEEILNNPNGLAFSPNGELYVAENGNDRISIFDAQGQYLRSFGESGSESGQFDDPQGLAFDAQGLLYVTEYGNHRIQVFNMQDQWLRSWGSQGYSDEYLRNPFGLLIDSTNNILYVADTGNHRIQHYDLQGDYLGAWQSKSSTLGEFNTPHISVSPHGDIYVADANNHRIQVFSASGQLLRHFGEFGSGLGQFNNPAYVAFDAQNRVYVSDFNNNRIQVFDQQGNYLSHWGISGSGEQQLDRPNNLFIHNNLLYINDSLNHRVQVFTLEGRWLRGWGGQGSNAGQFNRPGGIVLDDNGNVYVADRKNHRIQVFNQQGDFIRQWGEEGAGMGEFNLPTGLSLSPDGLLYVADAWNNRIQVFQLDGTFVESIGESGTQAGQFSQPYTVDFIDKDTLVVGDFANNRVQILRRSGIEQSPYKAIILAGGGPSTATYVNALWDSTQLLSNNAYFALRAQGYRKEAVKFLTSGSLINDLDENGQFDDLEAASLVSLEQAITSWAADTEDVLIYLIDHGGPGTFKINQHEILSREQLTQWVDRLQNQIPGKVTLIIEACQSASFFTDMGAPDRFLIASANKEQPAVISNQGLNAFSYYFWYGVHQGQPLQHAFKRARQGMSQQKVMVNRKQQYQDAQLDADGNGVSDTQDYNALGDYCLGKCVTTAADEPQIIPITRSTVLNGEHNHHFSIQVKSLAPVSNAWAIISRPDINYTDLNEPISDLPQINLPCSLQTVGDYICSGDYTDFNVNGDYSVTFHARDTQNRTSVPQAVLSIKQTGAKANRLEIEEVTETVTTGYSTEYNVSTGIVKVHDIEANGEHYQAILKESEGQFIVISVTPTTALFSNPAHFYADSRFLVIPEVQVGEHYFSAILQLSADNILSLESAFDLGLAP